MVIGIRLRQGTVNFIVFILAGRLLPTACARNDCGNLAAAE
jgi:hypothetical protein